MKKKLFTALALVVLGVGLFLAAPDSSERTTPGLINTDTQKTKISFQISIEGSFDTPKKEQVARGTTLLGYLQMLNQTTPTLNLGVKHYEGLGDLVERFGDKQNGQDGNYWQYSVNEKTPMVGADAYVLMEGDMVKWEFKKSEY